MTRWCWSRVIEASRHDRSRGLRRQLRRRAARLPRSEQGEASLAVGHELGRRALRDQISMLDIVENHFRLVDEALDGHRIDHAAAAAVPAADAGATRRRDARIPRRHKALRAAAGSRRRSRRPRRVPHRVGELAAGGLLRRRPRRVRSSRSTMRSARSPAMGQTVCRTSGRTRGWSTTSQSVSD